VCALIAASAAAQTTFTAQAPGFPAQMPPQGGRPPQPNAAADQPPGTATLRGHVFAADTGQPLRKAQVRIFANGPAANGAAQNRATSTDGDGRYEFKALPAGRYNITAAKGNYIALTEDPKVLQAMAKGAGPRRALFMLGYAGWAPGQLDAEMKTGAWGVAPADERLVFEEDPKQKWIEAMSRRILDL